MRNVDGGQRADGPDNLDDTLEHVARWESDGGASFRVDDRAAVAAALVEL